MQSADLWLVLPTYNEAGNLEALVSAVRSELDRIAPGGYRILIVDDESPDGTGDIADRLAAAHGEIEVLHRGAKDGLGKAYLAGFARALEAGARLVVQMDADFSHDPGHLPALIAAADDADLVLGSRYVPGGGVADWGLLRRYVSVFGGWYARMVLGLDFRDFTGGFKCIRPEVLRSIELDSLRSQGYVFQIELTYRAALGGFRVVEVPIIFREREAGKSKMSPKIAFEAIFMVPRLRRSARRFRPFKTHVKSGS